MSALLLARLQFALTIGFHFIFPPISIGLAWMLTIAEWLGWRKADPDYVRIGKFFGKLLAVNFAVGVATGIVMEFQFGTNWATYSKFVGDIFGAPLAAEGIFAFFLESGFMGLYLFGRERVSKRLHWFSSLMVAVGATLSAFWIIVANSWQQTPTGFRIVTLPDGGRRAELTNFYEAIFNPSTMPRYFHTMMASLVTGAFLMAGVAAWHVLRNKESPVARKALRLAVAFGLVFAVLEVMPFGHLHAQQVARTQPEKFAAIEGLYTSQSSAPLLLFAVPFTNGPEGPELKAKVEIPGLLSWMTFGDMQAHIQGLDEFPERDRPPLWLTFVSFHNMVVLGMYFIGVMSLAALRLYQKKLWDDRWLLKALVWSVPLPVVACELGWTAAEVGRQPWIVYRLLRTSEAHSATVTASEVGFSILLFGAVYLLLGALWFYLMLKKAKSDPDAIPVATSTPPAPAA